MPTLSIVVPVADVPRLTEAYGAIHQLYDDKGDPRPATQPEIEHFTKQWLIQSTQNYERHKNTTQFTPPPMEMT